MKRLLSRGFLSVVLGLAGVAGACQAPPPSAPPARDPRPQALPAPTAHPERRRTFDVLHRALRLEPDFTQATLRGSVTITLAPLDPGFRTLRLDADHLTIDRVTREGSRPRELAFQHEGAELSITLEDPVNPVDALAVTIDYHGKPARGMWFRLPDEAHPALTPQLWTQGEPEDARFWFPCYDAPNDRATTEMEVTVPAGFEAVSNGRLVERETLADGRERFHWRTEASLPAYLVSLVAGRFDVLEDSWEGIPLRHYVPEGRLADASRSFARTGEMLSFFSERIGVRYPYEKYAHACVRDFSFGGMENLSATTVTERTLHPARVHETSNSDGLVAHEMAHQWFGDLLTCRTWAHVWLNEGFATFFGILGEHARQGADEVAYALRRGADQVLRADRGKDRRPVVTDRYHTPIDLFDTYAYSKGAWVLRMLEGELGEERFWRGIRLWVERYRESAVTTDDFRHVMEEVSGRDLGWFFEQWCLREGHPIFEVSWTWNEDPSGVLLTWSQVQDPEGGRVPQFRGVVRVRVVGEQDESSMVVPFAPGKGSTFFAFAERPRFIAFDDGGYLLQELRWDRPAEEAARQLLEDREATGRVAAARELGKDGSPRAVRALAEALRSDRFWGVRGEAAAALVEAGTKEAGEAVVAALRDPDARVRRAACQALGRKAVKPCVPVLRALLARERNDDVVAAALGAYAAQDVGEEDSWGMLESFANRDSHGEVVRIASLAGRVRLDGARALDAVLEAVQPQQPPALREKALGLLDRAGKGRAEVRRVLEREIEHGTFRTRRVAVGALGRLGDAAAEPLLLGVVRDPLADGRTRAEARRAVEALRRAEGKAAK